MAPVYRCSKRGARDAHVERARGDDRGAARAFVPMGAGLSGLWDRRVLRTPVGAGAHALPDRRHPGASPRRVGRTGRRRAWAGAVALRADPGGRRSGGRSGALGGRAGAGVPLLRPRRRAHRRHRPLRFRCDPGRARSCRAGGCPAASHAGSCTHIAAWRAGFRPAGPWIPGHDDGASWPTRRPGRAGRLRFPAPRVVSAAWRSRLYPDTGRSGGTRPAGRVDCVRTARHFATRPGRAARRKGGFRRRDHDRRPFGHQPDDIAGPARFKPGAFAGDLRAAYGAAGGVRLRGVPPGICRRTGARPARAGQAVGRGARPACRRGLSGPVGRQRRDRARLCHDRRNAGCGHPEPPRAVVAGGRGRGGDRPVPAARGASQPRFPDELCRNDSTGRRVFYDAGLGLEPRAEMGAACAGSGDFLGRGRCGDRAGRGCPFQPDGPLRAAREPFVGSSHGDRRDAGRGAGGGADAAGAGRRGVVGHGAGAWLGAERGASRGRSARCHRWGRRARTGSAAAHGVGRASCRAVAGAVAVAWLCAGGRGGGPVDGGGQAADPDCGQRRACGRHDRQGPRVECRPRCRVRRHGLAGKRWAPDRSEKRRLGAGRAAWIWGRACAFMSPRESARF
ncbi:hypothetical protein SAMN05421850_101233 [Lutimaribacter saemankumensis]|uniref:Uncharacterized protein n=1 Tax=Lutimaribacter saemankumensis TaxID=490829 RepID=A0A1G8GUR7_9RHOB|nr:hypothetical protein SAMN05421850_101233 [Lutimaribacter saemankumensis]